MWKKHIKDVPTPNLNNIKPSCLKVDRATIFFASISKRAARLATISVRLPKIIHKFKAKRDFVENVNNNQIPAVTKVELCTKALTGVGAAIAAGSHLIKGH